MQFGYSGDTISSHFGAGAAKNWPSRRKMPFTQNASTHTGPPAKEYVLDGTIPCLAIIQCGKNDNYYKISQYIHYKKKYVTKFL